MHNDTLSSDNSDQSKLNIISTINTTSFPDLGSALKCVSDTCAQTQRVKLHTNIYHKTLQHWSQMGACK